MGIILGYLFTIPGVVLIIKEGGSREYEKVWDFVASLGGLHLILTCIGNEPVSVLLLLLPDYSSPPGLRSGHVQLTWSFRRKVCGGLLKSWAY